MEKTFKHSSTKLIIKSLRNLRVLRALRGEITFALSAVAALVLLSASPAHADTLEARLAPCLACHGAKGQSANPEVPSLGGQPAFYLTIQLLMFREKLRVVEPMNQMMQGLRDDGGHGGRSTKPWPELLPKAHDGP